MNTIHKVCTKCETMKPLSAYYNDKRTKDGRLSACKTCHILSTRAYLRTPAGRAGAIKSRNRPEAKERARRYRKTLKGQFSHHRSHARYRGIEFNLTFEEWCRVLGPYLHRRGRGKDAVCLGRFLDKGPYEIGNIYITTNSQNIVDQQRWQRDLF